MGSLVGHVLPGLAFFLLGFWHLFNHIKLHSLHPNPYTSPTWFPTPKSRHLELFLIMVASSISISISMELFISPARHQPLDPDGTIPSTHLHNFEHSSISMTFFTYAAFAIILDKISPKAKHSLTQFIAAVAFAQQLLLFHFHSADHMGVEGVWLIIMGYMIWTPSLVSKGCFLHNEDGHQVVRCSSDEALQRAKSLVNIIFSWTLIAVIIFSMALKNGFLTLKKEEDLELEVEEETDGFESQKEGKPYAVMDIER
ncbi:hypothetical protein GOBAR_AA19068 [Gossypium barbadense]|uniref:Uncharacterized protein n=1 Tax=Gossypium barbadense TaxID=3634 RepID=A0A2P5XE18_GOSBA|nr:hypothetical protein GOBAR_AA19068 [Gossypium barbadense]